MSGPNGQAISFYPGMPRDFLKTEESKLYTFTLTVPAKPDTKARIKELKERMDAEPRNGELHAELAAVYQYEGRLLEALNCLEAAMKDIPDSADVHGVHGETLAQMGRYEEAITHFERAIQLGPKNKVRLAAAHAAIGMCLHELGRTEESLSHFQNAAQTVPDAPNHHSNLGLTFVRLERYREAIKSYLRAIELDPSIAKNYFYLGIIHEIGGRTRDAVNQFQKAVDIAPDDAEALELLGQHAAKLGEHDRAISALRESIKIEKNERRLSMLGASLAAQQRWGEAEPLFREARGLAPRSFDVLRNLAVCLVQQQRIDEAIRLFEAALNEPILREGALACIEQLQAVLRGDLKIG
jgi:superkiller protein 3